MPSHTAKQSTQAIQQLTAALEQSGLTATVAPHRHRLHADGLRVPLLTI